EDDAGQESAPVGGVAAVDGVVVVQRTAAALQDTDADLGMVPEGGVEREQMTAVAEIRDAGVDDQAAQSVLGHGESAAAGNAFDVAHPGKTGIGQTLARPNPIWGVVVEVVPVVHVL